jgi:hypothetical protein
MVDTVPTNSARATKRWKLNIGTVQYQGHTSSIEYNSNTGSTVWRGGDDNAIPDLTPGDPSISITMAQDSANAASLWRVFFDADEGTAMTLIWFPHYDDATFGVSVDIKSVQPPLKTDRAGGVPEVTLQLPCTQAIAAS